MNANSEFLELGAVRRGKALGKSFGFLNYESDLPICPFPPIAEAARPKDPEVAAGRQEAPPWTRTDSASPPFTLGLNLI